MASLNRVTLIGRLTNDPEPVKTLNGGSTVTKFRMAVGRSKKNPQTGQWENDPNPLYIDCEAFARSDAKRNLPEIISSYLKQGSEVYVEGRLQLDQWDDKTTGQKRSKHKVVVEDVQFLGGGAAKGEGGTKSAKSSNATPAGDDYPSDGDNDPLPF